MMPYLKDNWEGIHFGGVNDVSPDKPILKLFLVNSK